MSGNEVAPGKIRDVMKEEQKNRLPGAKTLMAAVKAIDTMPQRVTVPEDMRSERYPDSEWVVSVPYQRRGYNDRDIQTFRLGYRRKKDGNNVKHPDEVHIIVDDVYGQPWATLVGEEWWQCIGSTIDDEALSPANQKKANEIAEQVAQIAEDAKHQKYKRFRRRVIGAVLGATVALSAGGAYQWNDARMKNKERIAAQKADAVKRFDDFWSTRKLTPTPIEPTGEFQAATEGALPDGAPIVTVKTDNDGIKTLSEPLHEGQVRKVIFNEKENACLTLSMEIGETATVSVLTLPTNNYVGAVTNPESNTLKLCVNNADEGDTPDTPIALQLTPEKLTAK